MGGQGSTCTDHRITRTASGRSSVPQARSAVMALMFELNKELGTTLVLVTHDKGIASRCERRITIEAGQVVAGAL